MSENGNDTPLLDDYGSEEEEDEMLRRRSGTVLRPSMLDTSRAWWDFAGIVHTYRTHGVPSLGCVVWASILSIAIVGFLVASLNPVLIPVQVQWEAGAAQYPHSSVGKNTLHLPDPSTTALAVWVNTTGLHCSNLSRSGFEADSPVVDLEGVPWGDHDDYEIYRGRVFSRDNVRADKAPFHPDSFESIETENLHHFGNRGVADEPILIFPMLGQTHIDLLCRSNEDDLRPPVGFIGLTTVPTTGSNYGNEKIAIGYLKQLADSYESMQLRITGAGFYSATVRPVPIDYITNVAAFSHAELSVTSIIHCEQGEGPSYDICDSLQRTAIIRLETPKILQVGGAIPANGAFGPFASFVGLVTGFITASMAVATTFTRVFWACRRKISNPDDGKRPDHVTHNPVGLCFGLHAGSARTFSAVLLAVGLGANVSFVIWFSAKNYLQIWGIYIGGLTIPIFFASWALFHLIASIFRHTNIGISAALLSASTVTMGSSVSLLPPVWWSLNFNHYDKVIPSIIAGCTVIYFVSMLIITTTAVDMDMAAYVTKHRSQEPSEMIAPETPDGPVRIGRALGFLTIFFRDRICCCCHRFQVVTADGENLASRQSSLNVF